MRKDCAVFTASCAAMIAHAPCLLLIPLMITCAPLQYPPTMRLTPVLIPLAYIMDPQEVHWTRESNVLFFFSFKSSYLLYGYVPMCSPSWTNPIAAG